MKMTINGFAVGDLVRVTYRHQAGNGSWYRRQMTAVYLGYNKTFDSYEFSLRPLMGTTGISRKHSPIEKIELVEEDTPFKYPHGIRDKGLASKIKLPKNIERIPKEEL